MVELPGRREQPPHAPRDPARRIRQTGLARRPPDHRIPNRHARGPEYYRAMGDRHRTGDQARGIRLDLPPCRRFVSGLLAIVFAPAAIAEPVLNVANWSDYIDQKTIEEFTRETGIRVVYDTYDFNEILETRLSPAEPATTSSCPPPLFSNARSKRASIASSTNRFCRISRASRRK